MFIPWFMNSKTHASVPKGVYSSSLWRNFKHMVHCFCYPSYITSKCVTVQASYIEELGGYMYQFHIHRAKFSATECCWTTTYCWFHQKSLILILSKPRQNTSKLLYKLASLKCWAVTCISCTFTRHNSVSWNVVGPQHITDLSILFWTKQIKAAKQWSKIMSTREVHYRS